MSEFLKIGNVIKPVPKLEGLSYDLNAGKVYNLLYSRENGVYLEENGDLNLPKKIYELEDDQLFMNRVLKYFNSELSGSTTGVILSGVKGTGKSILAKRLALASNLPIIVIRYIPSHLITDFFKSFTVPVTLIFDEFEKIYSPREQQDLLELLDGIETTTKKLCIFTCNNPNRVEENFFDRCSRVRYCREYDADSNDVFVKILAESKNIKDVNGVVDFIINNFNVKSFDNILSFLDEVLLNEGENLDYQALVKNMNISLKGDSFKGTSAYSDDDDYE